MKIREKLKNTFSKPRFKVFLANLVIGTIVSIVLFLSSHSQYIGERIDKFLDVLIYLESNVYKANLYDTSESDPIFQFLAKFINTNSKDLNNISFVEIDRRTLNEWNGLNLPVIPRKNLADLLEVISNQNPKVLVVDILFDTKCDENDRYLKDKLISILEKKDIKIVLPVIVDPKTKRFIYPYFYKDLKNYLNKKVFIGIPSFYASAYDNKARFINFYQVAYTEKNQKDIVWNSSLVAYTLYQNHYKILENKKKEILEKNGNLIKININKKEITINQNDLIYSRLRFPYSATFDENFQNLNFRKFAIYANKLKENSKEFEKKIKNKIIIIGSTDPLKKDIFKTPIGDMPGIYLIGNGIFTISNLQIFKENKIFLFVLQILSIIVVSILFATFRPFLSFLLSFLVLIILIAISAILFFKFNIFINVIFPIVLINIIRVLLDIERLIINKN